MDAQIRRNASKANKKRKRASVFMESLMQVLGELEVERRRLNTSQLSVLAYLIWDCDSIGFEDRICALAHLAERLPSNTSEAKCVYSACKPLRGFLRDYCMQSDLIRKEIFDSRHGIDFRWKLVGSNPTVSLAVPAGSSIVPFPFDDGYYGELDLCLEGVLGALRNYGEFDGTIIVTAQYWLCKIIEIELEFSSSGELLRVLQDRSKLDCCALLLSLLQVEADESSAYWRSVRSAKSEIPAVTQSGRINPLTDIAGNRARESKRDTYYKKYHGTIGAFSFANLDGLKEHLPLMQGILSEVLGASNC